MNLRNYLDKNGYKLIKSIFCFLTFMGLGGVCTLLGSSLLDIQIRIQQSFVTTSKLIPVRSIGYITGGLFSAFLGKFTNINVIMAITNFTGGFFLILAPWFTSIYTVAGFIYLSGISQGLFDIYSNVYIIRIWDKDATNYLQVHHMFFGVGALIVPLITRPFLLPYEREDDIDNLKENTTQAFSSLPFGGYKPDDVMIEYPYLITGLFLCIISIGYVVFYFKDKRLESHVTPKNENEPETSSNDPMKSDQSSYHNEKPWKKYVAIIPMMLIANISFGFTTTVGSLGPAFAVKSDLRMSKSTAALLVTVFWTMFCFYRIIFIPLTLYFNQRRLMLINLLLILVSVGLMVPQAAYNQYFTWSSFVLLGIGYSPTFSVSFALLQKYFPISGRLASFIFMNGCIGESIHPWLVAKFMEGFPQFFVYYLSGMCVFYVILNFFLPHLCNKLFNNPNNIN
ncbi:sodium-dependent glucose transporter 1-like [Panonychus citri]|uniref:sodium-dependent glucose transporter 1-like n=1 Tax=Panonychus citri TaxID=50023 RepID=UPI002307FDD5|nr:sodium-dependent glucose transporter 1-like [Panonychus citri]